MEIKKSEINYYLGNYDGEATLWDESGEIYMKGIYEKGMIKHLPVYKNDSIRGNKNIPVF
ncbi:MAG: hypothetical protein COX07_07625 [Bacteroidetes bacterium CG23_combo_of_CG06-09_8_20_14_all_32_9]|nr:MAG: hypothetical protein COX07_07625 [Bacteroidetes bacterium CG23_combo_of_CG06-09_8_20_14_all_32_9]